MTIAQHPDIQVPCNEDNFSQTAHFTLLPHTSESWLTFHVNTESSTLLTETLSIEFQNPKGTTPAGLAVKQFAELVVTLDQSVADEWVFYGNGVEYCGAGSNCQYNISTSIDASGKVLTLKVTDVGATYAFAGVDTGNLDKVIEVTQGEDTAYLPISFRYVAKHNSGQIYMSQDPKIVVRRPGNTL
ncbi:hypothetical protein HJP15_01315 [Pseudoalteromonas sp. NEC-BIFX-2020_002]|uniref:hypothetical protein n=1 Tax=unclassified Pseudoalteromonas TaxID=194690 RepID=UPI001476DC73|nr:hypothetical protein [Pseudoalteromonas sp. NEC-BIFX-2020_002]NNG41590.1 hypothetical protein [Pseudoalteromonas sp. NEC-BIFX-2020_002]